MYFIFSNDCLLVCKTYDESKVSKHVKTDQNMKTNKFFHLLITSRSDRGAVVMQPDLLFCLEPALK